MTNEFIEQQRNELKLRMKALREEFQNKSKEFFSQATQSLFEKHPELESFSWTQGQEYNDEGYEFYANTDGECLEINGRREAQVARSSYEINKEIKHYSSLNALSIIEELKKERLEVEILEKAHEELAGSVAKVLNCFNRDDYEVMFGDGYKITVNRGGEVNIEAYDHGY